jgi:tetratricopeptide (TPR) repeat protein
MTQNNLGNAYLRLPTGDRAENLERAIGCYREALRVYTPEAAPFQYATTQNNLGTAYSDLPTGDRAENLERAIGCYREALRVYTPEAAPLDYAMTQNNLGNAYSDLPTGDRAENLERAIGCYREALRFRTPEAAPLDYAMTQNNLGTAYSDLPTGDRAENLERAIGCYREALAIEYLPPWSHVRYLRNLGDACGKLEDYASAIAAYRQAIDLSPDDPWLFNAVGNAYSRQRQHEQAVEAYTAALELATTDADRALLYRNRASDLIHLHHLDEAEGDCKQARVLAPDHPYTHARLGQLAFVHGDYPAALEHYSDAIDRQPEADFYFDRGLAYLALGHIDQALTDYQAAIPLADPITIAKALEELDEFAVDHPDTPGLDAVRALLTSPP